MAGRVKITEKTEGVEATDTVLTFDNNKDYVAIRLKGDKNVYVEHKHFAKKLVEKKAAEYAKDVELEDVISNTQVLATKK